MPNSLWKKNEKVAYRAKPVLKIFNNKKSIKIKTDVLDLAIRSYLT